MIKRFLFLSSLSVFFINALNAQEQLTHEKKVYVSPEGKLYFNKMSPVYFRVAISADENAPSYLLGSEVSKKFCNPMYLDTEGKNTLHSPSAVDTATKKPVTPRQDVIFDIYADGIAPVTKATISNIKKHTVNNTTYYGKNLKFDIGAVDEVSGVEASYISVNQSSFQDISKVNSSFDEEKEYDIKYYSVDHVGNAEEVRFLKFNLDLSAPKTTLSILGENKGNVLSSKASISLTSRDTLSGVSRIVYSINDGPEKIYSAAIPLSLFKEGETKIAYYAVDNVGNTEDVKVISTSTEKPLGDGDASSFSFYIDKEAPIVNFEIVGDKYTGKSLFISERSQFQINATDEKSGVDKVSYSQNNPSPKQVYTVPFSVAGEGTQSISYAAIDYVGNYALAKLQQVYVDKSLPKSAISFTGKQFFNRDTLFITKDTKLSIASSELGSGIQKIEYVLDGTGKKTYSSPINIEMDGFHTLEYFATDNVNNIEGGKTKSFFVDNVAPTIHFNFSVKAIGEKTVRDETYTIYPSNTMLYIAATDNASGGERIEYKINGKPVQSVIPVKGFLPGNYEIEITAFDVLKNKSTQLIRFSIED